MTMDDMPRSDGMPGSDEMDTQTTGGGAAGTGGDTGADDPIEETVTPEEGMPSPDGSGLEGGGLAL